MADSCMVCGNGQLINGEECTRCGAVMDADGGGWSYSPDDVRENIDHCDDRMAEQGLEWDPYQNDYVRR